MRKKIIAGNWKMNKTPKEAAELVKTLKDSVNTDKCQVVFCVPAVALSAVGALLQGTKIALGAQNMHFEDSGAYTGEISGRMLKDVGATYVILGHSERRKYFGETDEIVNKKVKKAIEADLIPIVCVGENLEQREQNVTVDLVRMQTKIALTGVSAEQAREIVIAYEPIWGATRSYCNLVA